MILNLSLSALKFVGMEGDHITNAMMEIRSMETAAVEIVRLKIYTFAMAEDPHIETLVIIITLEAQF